MPSVKTARISLQIVTVFLLLIAVAISAGGLLTSSWQIADLVQMGEYHEQGLYEDCVTGWTRTATGGLKSEQRCFFRTFFQVPGDYSQMIQGSNMEQQQTPAARAELLKVYPRPIEDWRLTTLCLVGLAVVLAGLAMFVACCVSFSKCAAISAIVLTFVAAVFGCIGLIVFASFTSFAQNKFLLVNTGSVELHIGRSFYLVLIGLCLLLFAGATLLWYKRIRFRKSVDYSASQNRSVVYAQHYKARSGTPYAPDELHDTPKIHPLNPLDWRNESPKILNPTTNAWNESPKVLRSSKIGWSVSPKQTGV